MGGETEASVSPWTVDSLHLHLQKQIDDLEKHHEADIQQVRRETAQALAAKEKDSDKLERQMEKRFDGFNEFRGQLSDQASTFLTKETYEIGHRALEGKVDIIQNLITGLVSERRGAKEQVTEKRQDNSSKIGIIVAVATVINIVFVLVANGVFSR